MNISARFGVDALAMVAGAFLVVWSMNFGFGLVSWLGFGVSTGVLVVAIAGMLATRRLDTQLGHGMLGAVALWSLIAALVFVGSTMTWLVFADAIAIAAIGLIDLTIHEARTERVVHELAVHEVAAAA